jgi:predicted ATP-grasp superfamily ATP-dependent carboligase
MTRTKSQEIDVLLTQAWGKSAYNVVRSLGKRGLSVAVGTDKFSSMAAYSRYATLRFRHALPVAQTRTFMSDVRAALQRYEPKVYLPTSEDTYIVAKYVRLLGDLGTVIPIAPFETIRRLHKKDVVGRLACSLGIPTPETIVPRSEEDIQHFFRQFGAPIVLKRISSSGARGVFYVHRQQDIRPLLDRYAATGEECLSAFLVQQYVAGSGYGVSTLFNRGQLRASFTHRRLREKTPTGGISTLRVGVSMPVLEEHAHNLLHAVDFHGVAMVEFKYDERTRRSWLLEVNPRFWGSLALAIQSGVDFPYLLYRMAVDGDVAAVTTYRTGMVVRWLLGDLGAFPAHVAHPRQLWTARVRPSCSTTGYDDWYADDPLPFAASGFLALRKLLGTMMWAPDELDLNIDRLDHITVR